MNYTKDGARLRELMKKARATWNDERKNRFIGRLSLLPDTEPSMLDLCKRYLFSG